MSAEGYYGLYGGAFVPELLRPNLDALAHACIVHREDLSFQAEFSRLLRDYCGRPTPLWYAQRLSAHYRTDIWLKREDLNHTGSHKINNAIGQILLAERLGKTRIIAETGAGQHGVATATVAALKGLSCTVYMGARDIARQAPNVARMRMLGATVEPVSSGSQTLKDATNAAIRDWINHPHDTHYIIGSVVGPHPYPAMVAWFQEVISREIRQQFAEQFGGGLPDAVLACVGGGSNAIGAFSSFMNDDVRLITAEAAGHGLDSPRTAAATFTGRPGILHGAKTMLMQTPDGQVLEAHSISAGLDYPGIGPQLAHLITSGRVRSYPVTDDQALDAGALLARTEGLIPALESAHALALLELPEVRSAGKLVLNLSGRGDKDLDTYQNKRDS
ncbi:MAG: tryptophan synthase subunit beta [Saprospiraceae bacterium]|nr:tryptophan synthase subunit beta [Saprospiraceae bacterium]